MPLLWLVLLAGVAGHNDETSVGSVLSSSGTPTFVQKRHVYDPCQKHDAAHLKKI